MAQGAIAKLIWCDTRDMTADAHTKSSIDRVATHALMTGERHRVHEAKELMLPSAIRMISNGEQAQQGLGPASTACNEGDGPRSTREAKPPLHRVVLSHFSSRVLVCVAALSQCYFRW